MSVEVLPDADALAEAIAERLSALVATVQAQGRSPRIVLTGGTIAAAAYERIDADAADWANVEFWFGDERFVPEGHADRNDQQARDAFLDRVGATRVHSVSGNDCSLSAAEAADEYAATLPDGAVRPRAAGHGPRRPRRLAVPAPRAAARDRPRLRSSSSTPPSRLRCASR